MFIFKKTVKKHEISSTTWYSLLGYDARRRMLADRYNKPMEMTKLILVLMLQVMADVNAVWFNVRTI